MGGRPAPGGAQAQRVSRPPARSPPASPRRTGQGGGCLSHRPAQRFRQWCAPGGARQLVRGAPLVAARGTRGAAASRARAARREHPGAAPRRGARQVGRNLLSHSRRQRAAPQLPLRVLGVRQPRHGKLEHDLGAQPVAPGSELVTVGIGQQPGEEL